MHNRALYYVALGMAVATIIVTGVLILDRSNQIAAILTGFWDNPAYMMSQSDYELMRLVDTLVQSSEPDKKVDSEVIEIRFEVALGRFLGLTQGRSEARIDAVGDLSETVQNSITVLENLEPRILRFSDLSPRERREVISTLRSLSQQFHIVTVEIGSSGDLEHREFAQHLLQNARTEIFLLALLLLAGAMAFINAFRERQRYFALIKSLTQNVATRTTELEATNEQLREEILERTRAEERYRSLVELASDAIVIFDAESGRFIEANPRAARIFGYSAEDLLGSVGLPDLSPETQPDGRRSEDAARRYLADALQGNFPSFHWTHKDSDGRDIPCEVSLSRFPDPDRELVRASIVDVTERLEAERHRLDLESQLARAQKLEAIGRLTGGVAHDFNNLLNVILGNLELMKEEPSDTEKEKMIDAAITATFKGADLTKNMLSFARRAYLKPTQLDLSDTVRDMDTWIARTIPASIKVEKSLQEDLWKVEADLSTTESALLNLMINACDAMTNGGIITIKTTNVILGTPLNDEAGGKLEPGQYVLLSVRDNGTGISEEHIERVFEPFFTTKGPGEGSGLGLSMVHGFMRQSGGAARINSEVGSGTTVELYFPTVQAYQEQKAEPVAERDVTPRVRARILIAEDQEAVIDLLVRVLRKEGHEVVPALSGDQALEQFNSGQAFDLLITDIVMPGKLQGLDLARMIRRTNPEMPVIFMSGYAREGAIHGNGLHESDIRLMKPVSKNDLIRSVQAALTFGAVLVP